MAETAPRAQAPGRKPQPGRAAERLTGGAIWLFALVVVALFRLIDSTINLRIAGYEHVSAILRTGRPVLVVVWHGRGLLPIFFFQGLPLLIYSSHPRDGTFRGLSRHVRQLTLASLRHLGYQIFDAATFPSEPRGVVRFLHLLERARGGVIAADGPGGPMFRAKPGAVFMAKKTGVALLPVGAAMRDAIEMDSWDRFEIPRRGDGEAGFDDVHAQLFQLPGQAQLLLHVHGKAGGLLAVAQGCIKNVHRVHRAPPRRKGVPS